MINKRMGAAATAVLLASLVVPAFASAAQQHNGMIAPAVQPTQQDPQQPSSTAADKGYKPQGDIQNPKGDPQHRRFREARKLAVLHEAAAYFGIKAEGKTTDQLRTEVRLAKEQQPEKWAAFKASMKEKHFARLKKFAEKQGIQVEGKTEEQLRSEIRSLHEQGKLKLKEDKAKPSA